MMLKRRYGMLPIQKLLVPTDFSVPSYRGVKVADELAQDVDAELLMIHVVPRSHVVPSTGPPVPAGTQLSTLHEEIMDEARRFIFGSVAEKVVRLAECPALTIPTGEDEE
jgi:nucleotide-binding universal stress UspA family protein